MGWDGCWGYGVGWNEGDFMAVRNKDGVSLNRVTRCSV